MLPLASATASSRGATMPDQPHLSRSSEAEIRVTTAAATSDGEHPWTRMYFGEELVDVRCGRCGQRPLDVLSEARQLRRCDAIMALMSGLGL